MNPDVNIEATYKHYIAPTTRLSLKEINGLLKGRDFKDKKEEILAIKEVAKQYAK